MGGPVTVRAPPGALARFRYIWLSKTIKIKKNMRVPMALFSLFEQWPRAKM